MKYGEMGRVATGRLQQNTKFRLVVDELEFRLPRDEHAGFRLLDDEISGYT
jgi:hypothetical protein